MTKQEIKKTILEKKELADLRVKNYKKTLKITDIEIEAFLQKVSLFEYGIIQAIANKKASVELDKILDHINREETKAY